jgi:hypothetical protein
MGRPLHAMSDRSIDDERANNFPWRPSKLETISVCRLYFSCRRRYDTFFVSSQVNPTMERRLKSEGFRLGVDLILKHRNKSYMSSQLFAEYISTVLLPYVDELRSNEEVADRGGATNGSLFRSRAGQHTTNVGESSS